MPGATLRLDYIPFKVTTKHKKKMTTAEWLQLNSSTEIFFITFHVYEKAIAAV